MSTGNEAKTTIEAEVKADFDEMEAKLKENVGVFDLLAVCGGYEQALNQADGYLAYLRPRQTAATSVTSTSW